MQKTPKIRWKSIKIANIDRKILHIFWTTRRNSMKFFRKDVPYDNIKIHKKTGFHYLFRRNIFWTFFDVLLDSKMFEWLFGRALEIKYAPLNECLKVKTHDHFKIIILKWLCILQKNYDLVFFHFNMKNWTCSTGVPEN